MQIRILVTGGCGFIGANLVPMLIEHGTAVRVLDNFTKGSPSNLQNIDAEIVEGDIRDINTVQRVLNGVDTVIHLAAYGSVIESIKDPFENFDINVRGTLVVLQACINSNVQKIVFSSTGGALIGNAIPPVNENSVPKPISPYGASKLCCEAYCNAFANSYELQTVMLRFANVYGPYSAHKLGASTAFIKNIMSNTPIKIYGDGTATRDYLYVQDLCNGIYMAVEQDLPPATTLHLASGIETSVLYLAHKIIEVSGKKKHDIQHLPFRRGEVTRNFATYEKAKKTLGFSPSVSLDEGLSKTWEWFQSIGDHVFGIEN